MRIICREDDLAMIKARRVGRVLWQVMEEKMPLQEILLRWSHEDLRIPRQMQRFQVASQAPGPRNLRDTSHTSLPSRPRTCELGKSPKKMSFCLIKPS